MAKVSYGSGSIKVLKGLDPVRKRPGMYIGSTGPDGLHHTLVEMVDNAVDEAMAGHCTSIEVEHHADGSMSVRDNGRGIPTDKHPTEKRSGVELALTVLHAGGKFDDASYQVAGGLHGVGLSVVNALSAWMEVVVERDGERHEIRCVRGSPETTLRKVGKSRRKGTCVRYMPDSTIFTTVTFDPERVRRYLRQVAYLNAGLEVRYVDAHGEEKYLYKDGIREMVRDANAKRGALHRKIVHLSGEADRVEVDIALQYNSGDTEDVRSFVNGVQTREGGTHETGFRAALTHVVTACQAERGTAAQKKVKLKGDDLREGLMAVVSVRVREPQFEGQTKTKLGNAEVRGIVQSLVADRLRAFLDRHPKDARAIIEKAVLSARGREAARRARDLTRTQKSLLEGSVLPGKLADCSGSNPAENELFIVEGDSAGGSAKQARDRGFQAILPLRGKVINTERARLGRILKNEEIRALITAMGTGFDRDFDLSALRYHRLILTTDADVDGAHIRTLLLTFLFRHFPVLIQEGHVYIAQPPLYQVRVGKKVEYAYDDAERDRAVKRLGANGSSRAAIQRYKGLGEMSPEQLWETTMDPARRAMARVTLEDAALADACFRNLMGSEVEPRRRFIEENAQYVKNLDI